MDQGHVSCKVEKFEWKKGGKIQPDKQMCHVLGCTPEMAYQAFLFEFRISVLVLHSRANALGCRRRRVPWASFFDIAFTVQKAKRLPLVWHWRLSDTRTEAQPDHGECHHAPQIFWLFLRGKSALACLCALVLPMETVVGGCSGFPEWEPDYNGEIAKTWQTGNISNLPV